MRILYIAPSTIPSHSANSIHVMKMCAAFSSLGHKLLLIYPNGDINEKKIFKYYGIKDEFILRKKPLWFPARLFFLYSAIFAIKYKPDFIISRHKEASLICALLHYKVFYEVHINNILLRTRYFTSKLTKMILSNYIHRIIVISSLLKEDLIKELSTIKEKIIVLHDCAEIVKLSNEKCDYFELKYPQLNNNKNKIGYVGSLGKGKGIETILKIAQRLPEYSFHIVGGSSDQIESLKKGLFINNVFFYGYQPHNLIPYFLNQFDILLLPNEKSMEVSSGEVVTAKYTSPLKLFEYMASKRPIIVSDLPVLQEIIIDNYNGLIAKGDDIEDWVKKIISLLSDINLSNYIATNAFNDILLKYNWRKRIKEIIRIVYSIR